MRVVDECLPAIGKGTRDISDGNFHRYFICRHTFRRTGARRERDMAENSRAEIAPWFDSRIWLTCIRSSGSLTAAFS